MCGRYALAHPPRDVRQRLIEYGMPVDEEPLDEGVQPGYNIAPGNIEPVYRAIEHRGGNRPRENRPAVEDREGGNNTESSGGREFKYVLEPMKWGLIPSWTKRTPDYGSMLKTINCRDDSLFGDKGMWTSMKHKKRCIIVAQGFYEWLKKGKDKVPHFVKRKDGKLLCMAGLWDCVQYEGSTTKLYSYTIITTSSNPQLKFLHDRMPVILDPGSEDITTWLSPTTTWNTTLQSLLKPYEHGLEVYPVVKEVGNARNNSPTFIIPLDSKNNKANIKNFFASSPKKEGAKTELGTMQDIGVKTEPGTTESNAPQTVAVKREREDEEEIKAEPETSCILLPPSKALRVGDNSSQPTDMGSTPWVRSATSNVANRRGPPPSKKNGSKNGTPKITSFFAK